MEKQGEIREGLTPPENAEVVKQATAGQSVDLTEHPLKRILQSGPAPENHGNSAASQ